MKAFQSLFLIICSLFFSNCESKKEEIKDALNSKNEEAFLSIKHDNLLQLEYYNSGIKKISFEVEDYRITKGQEIEFMKVEKHSSYMECLNVRAGRKGSEKVANWFKEQIKEGSAYSMTSLFDNIPSKLNFAVKGTFTINYSNTLYHLKNVIFAQGSNSLHNNWWIGSPHMQFKEITWDVHPEAVPIQKIENSKLNVFFGTAMYLDSFIIGLKEINF